MGGMNPMMGGMGGMSGMGMNPMMNGGNSMNPQTQIGFNGQNSMLPSTGAVTKCQPLAHMKLCTTYDDSLNKLGINVNVGTAKRKKKTKNSSKSDRYKLKKNYDFVGSSQSNKLFPQYKNPFKPKTKRTTTTKKKTTRKRRKG